VRSSAPATFQLSTERLDLEWFSPELAVAVLEGAAVGDWGEGFPTEGERTAAHWVLDEPVAYRPPFSAYVVRERSSGLLIGGVGFHRWPENRSIEIGYGISAAYQGHRYASEACAGLATAALCSGLVDQVTATTNDDNERSKKVLARAGFTPANDRRTCWVKTP
jgi:[ribosomal protein S5]-alanine N-acetyltransferase